MGLPEETKTPNIAPDPSTLLTSINGMLDMSRLLVIQAGEHITQSELIGLASTLSSVQSKCNQLYRITARETSL